MKIIAFAGGSGSGKSTISYKLQDTYPKIIEILNLDDYQKVKEEKNLPRLHGMINWDHPDIINWKSLSKDINTLQSGFSITIHSWAHRSNPDYFTHKKMIKRKIHPNKILVIEGYLALWYSALRNKIDRAYFLDINLKSSLKRRKKFFDPNYDQKVLIPMHKKYVEPTKKFADVMINISEMNKAKVFEAIKKDLKANNLLS